MRDRAESASALCVLLLCFDGAKRAAQIRRPLSKQLEQHGSAILDAAIIRVDGEGKARVYDPQRTVAGASDRGADVGGVRRPHRRVKRPDRCGR